MPRDTWVFLRMHFLVCYYLSSLTLLTECLDRHLLTYINYKLCFSNLRKLLQMLKKNDNNTKN